MKNWIAAIAAALIVLGVGTAFASIPNGSETHFQVEDPAVTVIGSGAGSEGGAYSNGTTLFTTGSQAFTAVANGVCLVNINGQILGSAKVQYGVVEEVNGGEPTIVGSHSITTTQGDFSGTDDAATLAKNELLPVEAGKTYVFGVGIEATASGTAYPVENYVCFGA